MQELSSLFMTHRLNVMHAPIKFHEYIPYGLGVTAQANLAACCPYNAGTTQFLHSTAMMIQTLRENTYPQRVSNILAYVPFLFLNDVSTSSGEPLGTF